MSEDRPEHTPPKGKPKRPRDLNLRAKQVMEQSVGEYAPPPEPPKNPQAVERGRLGGLKGGRARAEKMSPERRNEIARQAVKARWSKS